MTILRSHSLWFYVYCCNI